MSTADIARRYRRTPRYVRERWVNSQAWRERVPCVGKRGVAKLYDAAAAEALVGEWVWLPPADSDVPPNQLLDQHAIADYTGFDYGTVRSDASPAGNNVLGEPDWVRDGIRYWKRSTVDDRYWARARRDKQTG